ncbi:hypothetical protein BaRGS_00014481 [Batillaria attramentaria]|uniref:Uncharacterized protein n=1 Tax=Batillaria attramentaria TaxID=370345 RepID=A0ABD0L508_9CAEN
MSITPMSITPMSITPTAFTVPCDTASCLFCVDKKFPQPVAVLRVRLLPAIQFLAEFLRAPEVFNAASANLKLHSFAFRRLKKRADSD